MGLVSTLLFGYRVIVDALGVPVATRNRLRFMDAFSVVDNASTGETEVRFGGASATPTFGDITASSITMGGYYEKWQPTVSTTTNTTANLLATAVSIPSGKGVRVRARIAGQIVTQSQFKRIDLAVEATYINLGGTVAQASAGEVSGESSAPAYPWSIGAPTTITGAADNGSGLTRIAVASSANYAAGNTITIAGAVTSGLTLNQQWIVDSVPNSTHLDLRGSTFAGSWTSGGTVTPNGALGLSLSGTSVQVTATGFKPAAWMQSEAVHAGDLRSDASGIYIYGTGGTTEGSGTGPTGTGTGYTDGSASADYAAAGPGVPIAWSCYLETWTT